jgi:predicted RNA-binding Zn-ribbon protein involved in translation (DUF1610 family)
MEEALKLGAKKIQIRGDSELIIRQMRGEYRVKHPDLKPLYEDAYQLFHQFDEARIDHNLRGKNELADKLANLAMDRKAEVTDVDSAESMAIDEPSPVATQEADRFTCPKCGGEIEVIKPSPIRPHQLKPYVCQCGTKMNRL